MPSRGFGDAHAVTRTTDSPMRTMTEPSACFAYLPVSKERGVPLISTSRLFICASEDHCRVGEVTGRSDCAIEQPSHNRLSHQSPIYLRMPRRRIRSAYRSESFPFR